MLKEPRRSIPALLAMFVLLSAAGVADANEVGATDGSLSVTPAGKASYVIPVDVPPGVRGVAPSVAIQYVSGGSNGVVGEGGSLAAVSSITRCSASEAEDGFTGSVLHRAEDRFCLNGQRLVGVSGVYGEAGAEYRTRVETFKRVRSFGAIAYPDGGTGPVHFVVEGGDGSRAEFGASADSRITHPVTGVVDQWLLTRSVDPHGNEVTYQYADFATGDAIERHLERISYGGNADQGVAHHLAVVFTYEPRPDESTGFRRGMALERRQRLAQIHTEAGGAMVRRYTLAYSTADGTNASRLVAVQECAGETGVCYNPTTFEWTEPVVGWNAVGAAVPDDLLDAEGRRRGVLTDVDGDGRVDWVTAYVDDTGTFVRGTWLRSPGGWTPSTAFEAPAPLFDYTLGTAGAATGELTDLDGDGLPEFVEAWRDASGADHHGAWRNTGDGFVADSGWHLPDVFVDLSAAAGGVRRARFANIDHDPFVDLITAVRLPSGAEVMTSWVNTGSGWTLDNFALPAVTGDYAAAASGLVSGRLVDINGDGVTDFVEASVMPDGATRLNTWLRREDGFVASSAYRLPVPLVDHRVVAAGESVAELADVNGDGLPDVVQSHLSQARGTETAAWLNTGAGWVSDASFVPPARLARGLADGRRQALGTFIDLDGDGRPDFVTSYRPQGASAVQQAWLRQDGGWLADPTRNLPLPVFSHPTDDDSHASATLIDVNGDNGADLVPTQFSASSTTYLNSTGADGRASHLAIHRIVNGLGFEQRVEYQHSDDTDVYTPAPVRGQYPVLAVEGPMRLVGAVETSDGLGGFNRSEYRYGELRVDVADGRQLGFGWMTVRDTLSDSEVTSEFSQAWPHAGSLLRKVTRVGATVIGEETVDYDALSLHAGATVFPFESGRVATRWELDGTHVSTQSSTVEIDGHGAPVRAAGETSDETGSYAKVVENEYDHDTVNWILSKATRNVTTVTAPGQAPVTRTVAFDFNADGTLASSTREPGHPQAVTTSYTYDGFGNRVSTTASANGETPRTGSVVFSADGRFPLAATNAAGHVSEQTYDGATGNLLTSTDPNGIVVTRTYDELGHPLNETRTHVDDAGETIEGVRATLRHWCDVSSSCPEGALYFSSAFTTEGDAPETVYYDLAGREIRRQSRGFAADGAEHPIVYRDIEYNARGQQARVSSDYFAGDTPEWTTFTYDALDRPVTQTGADGAITRTFHEGRTRRTRNALGAESTVVVNANGKPVRSIDAMGNEITFEYDAAGRLVRTTDPHGNEITTAYDVFGRKTALSDPDKGDWTYEYNAFGELIRQTDARGQSTTLSYDALGRLVSRLEPEGQTTWQYDSAPNGIGKLHTVSRDDGYSRTHAFDDRGRPASETVVVDGRSFTTHYRYQGTSERVDHVIYPSGLTVRRRYDAFGHPLDIRSDGLVELEAYQAQLAVVDQREADWQALSDDLQPQWDDHQAQATALVDSARPYWDDARRLSDQANRLIGEANDALAEARGDYEKAARYAQKAKQHDNAAKAYAHSYANHYEICEDPNSTAGQIHVHCAARTQQGISGQKELDEMAEDAQRANAYARRAEDYQDIAEGLFGQAGAAINGANAAERAANDLYAEAGAHVEAMHAIEQQLVDAESMFNQAVDKAEQLEAAYHGAATLHWSAEQMNARGDLERFTTGNGIVTEISHFADTGRIASIHARGDPAAAEPLSAEAMQALLDRLNDLIGDYSLEVLEHQAQADNARADQSSAEQQAVLAREQAAYYRANGQGAFATVVEAEAFQHDANAAVFATRIELNDGLAAIYQQTTTGAAALVLDNEDRLGEPGAGRALEAAYHHLLAEHYQAIDALYATLTDDFHSLQAASSEFAAPDAAELAEFADLAVHSQHLADLNQLRADAYQGKIIAALDGGGEPTTPLSRRALGLDASLIEKQAGLIDLGADAADGVARFAAPLNAVNALHQIDTGRLDDDSVYLERTSAYTTRVEQGRRLADIYRSRGVAILAELEAEITQAEAAGDEAIDNPFEDLVVQYAAQAGLFEAMSEADYWSELHATLGADLAGVAAHYQGQADEHRALAEEHLARATSAENAASHQVRIGDSGEIIHESYLYDAGGRLTARQDHAIALTESYTYDALNRLTESQVSGPAADLYAFAGLETVTYAYDALGNLLERSDLGTYTYGGTRTDGSAIGPHAVTRVNRLDGATLELAYDANGNLTAGDGRSVTWTSFDKPATITASGPISAPTTIGAGSGGSGGSEPASHLAGGPGASTFTYGPERQLVKHVETVAGEQRTTYGIGRHYEHLVSAAGETSRFNITYGGAIVAVIEQRPDDAPDTHYLHTDRLGSVVAVTDEHGYLIERYRYDPFGQRRLALYDGGAATAENLLRITHRGYTGHRELAGTGLVHMGGRVYHPGLARFLCADPFIQSPLSTQSYNRYSYLWNSPVNGTDPSGYFSYNPNIPRHLSGYESWKYIASDQFNLPRPTKVNWSLSQARAHRAADLASANLLIQAELPHINRNFSREELYKIGTGRMNIGLDASAQKRINGVIHQAWQWGELAREIKKASSGWRQFAGTIITGVLIYFQVPPQIAGAVGGAIGAAANGGDLGDIAKAGLQGYLSGKAYASTGSAVINKSIGMGQAIIRHGVIGGIMADWNGGSFSDGFVGGVISKGASFWAAEMGFGVTSAANYFTTIAAAGITAEITGADLGDTVAAASIGWFSNQLASNRGARNNPRPALNYAGVMDDVGSWGFVGWQANSHNGWWSHYRSTSALCQCSATGEYRQTEEVLYEQWRPMAINAQPFPGTAEHMFTLQNLGMIDFFNNSFDFLETMHQAWTNGSRTQGEALYTSPAEAGQRYCISMLGGKC